ncbi:MAG: AEC family transporter [Clostridium sp.]|nr:AEC family transporter [Clostridium sp.]
MEIKAAMGNVISLFLIILAGVYGVKRKFINDEIQKGLNKILINITLPLLVVTSFSVEFDDNMKSNLGKAFLYSFIFFIVAGVISKIFLIPIKDKESKKVLQFANVFSNCAFIGFPIISSIYGAEGVVYTSIFNLFFNIFVWSYGVALYSDKLDKRAFKKILLNPGIVAVYVGLPIMLFNIHIPLFLEKSISTIGNMTTPLSMIIIGCILTKVNIKEAFKNWIVYYESLIRLIIIPICIFCIAKLIKDDSILIKTIIVLQAMPAGTMASIMAENLEKDSKLATVIIFVTTLFSIVTFPLILSIIS